MMPLFAARDTDAVIAAMEAHRRVRIEHIAEWEAARTTEHSIYR